MLRSLVRRFSTRFLRLKPQPGPVNPGIVSSAGAAPAGETPRSPQPKHSVSVAHPATAAHELHGDADLQGAVRRLFVHRLRELESEFAVVSRENDTRALLNRLENSQDHLIRQLPVAAERALTACRSRTSSIDELTDLMEHDPAMTQDLLHHANSAFYQTGAGNVGSVRAAIQRIGLKGTESVIMRRVVGGLMSRPGDPYDRMVGMVWPHLVRTARIARALARAFRVNGEKAFTLGLLHDAGKLVFFDHIASLRSSRRHLLILNPIFVTKALRLLHEPIGGIAAAGWGLDDDSIVAITVHHRDPVPPTNQPLSEVVYAAERLDNNRETGTKVTLAKIWRDGRLTGDLDAASNCLADLHEDTEAS